VRIARPFEKDCACNQTHENACPKLALAEADRDLQLSVFMSRRMGRASALSLQIIRRDSRSRSAQLLSAVVVLAATCLMVRFSSILDSLSLALLIVLVVLGGGFCLCRRSVPTALIQSMHSGQKRALRTMLLFDLPEGPDCSHQPRHGQEESRHQACDGLLGSVSGDFHVATIRGSTEVVRSSLNFDALAADAVSLAFIM